MATLEEAIQEWGPIKRAWLSMARARTDIIHSLDVAAVSELAQLTLPYRDRKVRSAREVRLRLAPSPGLRDL